METNFRVRETCREILLSWGLTEPEPPPPPHTKKKTISGATAFEGGPDSFTQIAVTGMGLPG